ncbi:hypothetical protein [Aquabacterium sp.]|uniref:hypothetical protein n=1 Tax=Aquabacterium sp. TaxID=1872578 RepID=UPI002CD81D28|nr:hypothetical protein [Aquabacterium sp.]HSW04418.1 hypothetical protein [Aquabacterium sp.]
MATYTPIGKTANPALAGIRRAAPAHSGASAKAIQRCRRAGDKKPAEALLATPRIPSGGHRPALSSRLLGITLVFLLVMTGMLLVPAFPLAGVAVVAISYWVSRLVGGRSDEAFIAWLVVLGGLCALVMLAMWIAARF